jgi:hypothetical protein
MSDDELTKETSEKVIARSEATKQSLQNDLKTRLLRQKTSRNDSDMIFFRSFQNRNKDEL